MTLESRFQRDGTGARVVLKGTIDAELQKELTISDLTGPVVFDLGGVDRITSFGVREWIEMLNSSPASYVAFVNVRPALVSQFNMVSGFAGRGQVVSMFLPYVCDWCDHETELLVDLRSSYDIAQSGEPPPHPCAACGAEMEFDEIPSTYFHYVASQPMPAPPGPATQLIDGRERATASAKFGVKKEVAGQVTGLWLTGPIGKRVRPRKLLDGLEGKVVVVVQGVSGFEEGGAARFQELVARSDDYELQLARVPAVVLDAIDDTSIDAFKGRALTLALEVACDACRSSLVIELDRDAASAALTAGSVECPNCKRALGLKEQRGRIERALIMLSRGGDKEMRAYLRSRPGGVLEDTASTSRSLSSSGEGNFVVIRQIGRGGMAQVFLAKRTGPQGFEKRVVLKRVLPELCQDARFVEMFLEEARTAALIDHPHVVQIFDLGKDGDSYYIVMEYVRGWDLRAVLSTCRKLEVNMPVEFALRIAADVASGLQAAHTLTDANGNSHGIVHRDVSPHNILVSAEGSVKLTDFGIAKAIDEKDKTGELRGKVIYMAPEQVSDSFGQVNATTDVYAAGLVLYECLAGFAPFRRDTQANTLRAVLRSTIPDIRTHRSDVPDVLADTLAPALHRDQSQRYQSALELQLALERAISAIGKPATPAHFATWLEEVRDRANEDDLEVSRPMHTPATGTMEGSATIVDERPAEIARPSGEDRSVVTLDVSLKK